MAEAPDPRTLGQPDPYVAAQETFTIQRGDEPAVVVAYKNLPIREDGLVRKVTGGLPLEAFWEGGQSVNRNSMLLMWWIGRRLAGEQFLSWGQVLADAEPYNPAEWTVVYDDGTTDTEDDHPEG
jgi:hypothetical protein